MAGKEMPGGHSPRRYGKRMSALAGEPILAAARVNVAGLITYPGLAFFIMAGSSASLVMTYSDLGFLGFIFAFGLQYVPGVVREPGARAHGDASRRPAMGPRLEDAGR